MPSPAQAATDIVDAGAEGIVLRTVSVLVLLVLAALAVWAVRRSPKPKQEGMRVLEHVEELRRRLILSLGSWLVAAAVAFSFRYSTTVAGWPLLVPALHDNIAAQAFRVVAAQIVPDGVRLVVTRPLDGFMAELILALGIGFVAALPFLLWQASRFLGPALRPHEARAVRNAIVPAFVLFVLGAAFAWFWVLPFLLRTLYGYAAALGAEPLLVVSDLITFTVGITLVFGIAFQTPLVMHILARVGAVRSRTFLRYWRHAALAILVLSALVTDPTIVSQVLVAVPLTALYFLGVAAARWGERVRATRPEA